MSAPHRASDEPTVAGMARFVRSKTVVALLAASSLLSVGCGFFDLELGAEDTISFESRSAWTGVEAFEGTFQVDVPPSARNIDLLEGGFQDTFYHVRFEIDGDDLARIESSPGCGGWTVEEIGPVAVPPGSTPDVVWWPESFERGLRCNGYEEGSVSTDVVVDVADPDAPAVLVWAFHR